MLFRSVSQSRYRDAGLVGSQVHNLIEDYIHKGIVPEIHNPEIKKSFGKFKEWFDKQEGLEIVFTERKVLSRIHKFTGITKLLTPANVIGLWSAKICAEEFKKLVRAGVSYDEIELTKIAEQIKKTPN